MSLAGQARGGIFRAQIVFLVGFNDELTVFDAGIFGTVCISLVLTVDPLGSPVFGIPSLRVGLAIYIKFICPFQFEIRAIRGDMRPDDDSAQYRFPAMRLKAYIHFSVGYLNPGYGLRQPGAKIAVSPQPDI